MRSHLSWLKRRGVTTSRSSRLRRSNRTDRRARRRALRLLTAGVEPLESRALLATIAVTSTADVVDPGDGQVTLREAIQQANADAGPDRIELRISPSLLPVDVQW